MRTHGMVVKTAEFFGVLVLVLAALPLVALAGWLARGVAVVVGLVGVVGVLLLCGIPAFRSRLGSVLGKVPLVKPVGRQS